MLIELQVFLQLDSRGLIIGRMYIISNSIYADGFVFRIGVNSFGGLIV